MKATGIVRRIDDLGRVVIPKEIRRTMRIREGDPLEIFTDKDGELIFKKYSPIGELSEFAAEMCESLRKATGGTAAVCDRDSVIAISGPAKKELHDKAISQELVKLMENRAPYSRKKGDTEIPVCQSESGYAVSSACPILTQGDIMGSVLFINSTGSESDTAFEEKLLQVIALFLGKQMED